MSSAVSCVFGMKWRSETGDVTVFPPLAFVFETYRPCRVVWGHTHDNDTMTSDVAGGWNL